LVIVHFFHEKGPKNCISFRPHKTWILAWWQVIKIAKGVILPQDKDITSFETMVER
jgi:hypothetical protein